jgi:hypothetical protein
MIRRTGRRTTEDEPRRLAVATIGVMRFVRPRLRVRRLVPSWAPSWAVPAGIAALAGLAGATACAADAGDPLKTDSSGVDSMTPIPSSGSSSGETPTGDDASQGPGQSGTPEAAAIDDAPIEPVVEAAPPPPSCTTCPLTVEYYTRDLTNAQSTQAVAFDVQITNNGSSPQALANLTLRYWFTADGVSAFTMNEYYAASPINGNVTGTFAALTSATSPAATSTADTYLEVSFGAGAGSIAPMSNTGDIQLAFHDTSYSKNLDETNDYSYTASDVAGTCANGNTLTCQSPTVTLYRDGMLAFGTPPGGSPAPAGDP